VLGRTDFSEIWETFSSSVPLRVAALILDAMINLLYTTCIYFMEAIAFLATVDDELIYWQHGNEDDLPKQPSPRGSTKFLKVYTFASINLSLHPPL